MPYEFKNKTTNPFFSNIEDVTPQDVLTGAANLTLVDVRELAEYTGELGHAPRAEHIVLSTLPTKIKSLPRDKTIVFICRSGARSAQAAAFAKSEGINSVYNMKGGMLLWNQLKLPTE